MSKINIVLSLISHTNVGKTTLTRTLLKADVGEVRDEAHVTDRSSAYTLVETEQEALVLWDTPGFGNVAKLLKRLGQEGGAWGWLMHEVVDRAFNRSLYSSLEAARNVRGEAEVVLYLVNVREKPQDAGYVGLELKLLDALDKPVMMILNQVDRERVGNRHAIQDLERQWYDHFKTHACLKGVLTLDAFVRTWRQEMQLIDRLSGLVSEAKRPALARLRDAYAKQVAVKERAAMNAAAKVLHFAAHQEVSGEEDPKDALRGLMSRLQGKIDAYLDELIQLYGIESEGQAQLRQDIEAVSGGTRKMDETRSGLLAGAIASAGSGLMADILAGGLTFGGGALIGFMGGFMGGMSYAKVLNLRSRKGPITWRKDALERLLRLLLSYYLLTAIHGRGQGKLMLDLELAPYLNESLNNIWPNYGKTITELIEGARSSSNSEAYEADFRSLFEKMANQVLDTLFT